MKPLNSVLPILASAALLAFYSCDLRAQSNLSASIYVDTTQIQRVIPSTLYGTTVEWKKAGNGVWNFTNNAIDPYVGYYTWLLRPSLIRFPGGMLADYYHWTSGVGPASARPPTPVWTGGPLSTNVFGTDEALQLSNGVGAQLLITANFGTGTASEAASWVRYVNGSGTRVKYWEVGNELYDTLAFMTSNITVPPDQYAAQFLSFAQAMRQADPNIKIGAIGGVNFGNNVMNTYIGWDYTVLSTAASQIDFFAVHNSYAPINLFDQNRDVRSVYSALLAAPIGIGRNLQTIANEITAFAPSRASQISIAVTEWGAIFDFLPSPYSLHPKTLGSALYAASTLKQFILNPKTEVACMFLLVQDDDVLGSIGTRGGFHTPNAPYYALQMYTNHFGTLLVPSAAASPTYDSPAIGVVAAEPNVPYLDVITSLSTDRKTLYIMAINKHFDLPIQTNIAMNGFTPASSGTAWVLRGTSIDANTGTDAAPGFWPLQMQDPLTPRFYLGSPTEVSVQAAPVTSFSKNFTFTFPPHSVTSLELHSQ